MDKQPIAIIRQADLPVLSAGHLPKPVADWCMEISRSLGVCPTMPINMATSIVSSLFQNHFDAEIYPGYIEPLACYTAILAEPGERKTAVWKSLMAPLKKYCVKKRSLWTAKTMLNDGKAKAAKKRIEILTKDKWAKVEDIADQIEIVEKASGEKQFIVEDFTSAALAGIMATNNSILISTDEGEVWKKFGSGYGEDIGLLLRAHTAESYVRNRKGDDASKQIDRPVASICISMQPSVISNGGANDTLSGQGLLARFFIAVPEPKAGKFDVKFKPYDKSIEQTYEAWMMSMCELIDEEVTEITHIGATEGALEIFEEFARWCAWESRQDESANPYEINNNLKIAKLLTKTNGPVGALTNMRGWSSKLSGAAIRISCLRAASRMMQYAGDACPQINSDDAAHAVRYCVQSIAHMDAVGRLLRGENWIETGRAKAIIDSIGWPKEQISMGRLINLLREASGSRAGVERCIKDLIEKEHLIFVDQRTVRSNECYTKVKLELGEQQ